MFGVCSNERTKFELKMVEIKLYHESIQASSLCNRKMLSSEPIHPLSESLPKNGKFKRNVCTN